MAFFRNFVNDTVSHGAMEDKGLGQDANNIHRSIGNECTDATSSEKEFDMNLEAQYESDGGPDGACRLQNEGAADNGDGLRESNLQASGSKASTVGRWGSTFWKDCQPSCPQNGFESGKESKSGSDYRNAGGSEDNSVDGETGRLDSEDDDGQKEAGKGRRSHSDVPAEEMLSDEYYEQDGEDQSDSLHYNGIQKSTGRNSWPQQKSTSVKKPVRRKSRISDDDGDGDVDYEEEDEVDEDDPDDADFEPVESSHTLKKDKDWEGEGSDENDDSDESLDVSDDDESFYTKKAKGRQRGKVGKSIKSTRDRKACVASSRQRRLKSSFEDNESTTDDSDSVSDDDFKSTRKRSFNVRKNNSRFSVNTSFSAQNSDVRTSSRAVRKISYVESDGSEEADDGKKKKSQKD